MQEASKSHEILEIRELSYSSPPRKCKANVNEGGGEERREIVQSLDPLSLKVLEPNEKNHSRYITLLVDPAPRSRRAS